MNKLKIGIGICSGILGIALINNVQNVNVHADAINWDNQNAGNEDTNKVVSQSINNVRTSNVQSTKISNVQAGQIDKTKIAQFNSNSKIYGLNNGSTLSKNNGDGYVITNAGTFNGRPVDIGVTINNVQNNRGSYTTKWSNGDKADAIGRVDNQFDYQNGVTLNSNALQPVAPNQTRSRTENQQVDVPIDGLWVKTEYFETTPTAEDQAGSDFGGDEYSTRTTIYDPKLIGEIMQQTGCDYKTALSKLGINLGRMTKAHANINIKTMPQTVTKSGSYVDMYDYGNVLGGTLNGGGQNHDRVITYHVAFDENSNVDKIVHDSIINKSSINIGLLRWPGGKSNNPNDEYNDDPLALPGYADGSLASANFVGGYRILEADSKFDANHGELASGLGKAKDFSETNFYLDDIPDHTGVKYVDTSYNNDSDLVYLAQYMEPNGQGYKIKVTKPINVTDHLQIDQVKNGSLNYDYTIGLYDAQTGDLITSLKSEYKNGVKVGRTATNQDTVMNNAIKNKIADINANKAAVAFNGTAANDDVAFYQETTPVQDASKLTATASRTITLHFPNNQKPASYDNVVNNNNQIVQTLKFTRTGTTDLVTGQTTYTNWQGDSKFPDVKLPKIPGFKLQIS